MPSVFDSESIEVTPEQTQAALADGGAQVVEGVADLALVLIQEALPVGGGVENALRDGGEDLEDLAFDPLAVH